MTMSAKNAISFTFKQVAHVGYISLIPVVLETDTKLYRFTMSTICKHLNLQQNFSLST